MSLFRASLPRLLPRPQSSIRTLSTTATLRDASSPAKVVSEESRDIIKEQHERQSNAVVADVVNDAPCAFCLADSGR